MNEFLLHTAWLTLSLSLVILIALLWSKILGKRFSAKSRYTVWVVVILTLSVSMGLFRLPALFTVEVEMPSFAEDAPAEEPSAEDIPGENPPVEIPPEDNTPDYTPTPSDTYIPAQSDTAPVLNTPPSITTPVIPSVTDTSVDITPPESEELSPVIPDVPDETVDKPVSINLPAIIFWVWLSVAILYFGAGIAGYISTTHKYARGKAMCDRKAEEIFLSLCSGYGIKRIPRIYVCKNIGSPVLYGYFKPTVLLPDMPLSDNALAGVLSHELTHYKRGDIWVKMFCLLAESLYWFNPLVHIASSRCNAEMELSCDEAVLSGMDEDARRSYGDMMLDIVRHCSKRKSALTTQFNPHKNAVRERILNILDMTKKSRGRLIIAVCLVLCITVGTLIGCAVKEEIEKIKAAVYTVEAGITTVDESTFEAVDTDSITELVVSRDVEKIDFAYINTFPALERVTVDEENENYFSHTDDSGANLVVSPNTSELLYIPTADNHGSAFLWPEEITGSYTEGEDILMYSCGGVFEVYYRSDVYDDVSCWFLKSVEFDGIKTAEREIKLTGNMDVDIFSIEGGLVFSQGSGNWMDAVIFQNGSLYEYDSNTALESHGPYAGYINDTDTEKIDIYTNASGEYVTGVSTEILSNFMAQPETYQSSEKVNADFYCGISGNLKWVYIVSKPVSQSSFVNLYTEWNNDKSTGKYYFDIASGGQVTGAVFVSEKVGFIGLSTPTNSRFDIYATFDSGASWQPIEVDNPADWTVNHCLIPVTDSDDTGAYSFIMGKGGYPFIRDEISDKQIVYLTADDNGSTWRWTENEASAGMENWDYKGGMKFYPGENGELCYTRTIDIMTSIQVYDWFLQLHSAEQLWMEEGVLTLSDDKLMHETLKTYTVSDLFQQRGETVEGYFEKLKDAGLNHGYETLYDMFSANRGYMTDTPDKGNRNPGVLTIPDGVTTVDESTFETVDTDSITELVIGRDVEKIDFAYINTFPALERVTVDEENENYHSYEDKYYGKILISLHSDEILWIPVSFEEDIGLLDADILTEVYTAESNIQVYIGGGKLNLYFKQNEHSVHWYLRSLEYNGMTHELGYVKSISGNCTFRVFRIDGGFVATHAYYTWSNAFIFKNGEFIEYNPNNDEPICILREGDGIYFYPGENGELMYGRVVESMVLSGQSDDWFMYITSAEDLWMEEGEVTVSDGTLIYTPTKTYTVTDFLANRGVTVEEQFEQMKAAGWFNNELVNRNYETVEDMFAANRGEAESLTYIVDYTDGISEWTFWSRDVERDLITDLYVDSGVKTVDLEFLGSLKSLRTFTVYENSTVSGVIASYAVSRDSAEQVVYTPTDASYPPLEELFQIEFQNPENYLLVEDLTELPADPETAWRTHQPIMSPTYYFYDQGLSFYCRYEYNGVHYERNTLLLPEGYTNGRIVLVTGTGGSASMYVNVKTDQGYLRYGVETGHAHDSVYSVTVLPPYEVKKVQNEIADEIKSSLDETEIPMTQVTALPKDESEAICTDSCFGGNPTYYFFGDGLTYYRRDTDGTYYKATLPLPKGYSDGIIVSAGSSGGSGELQLIVETAQGYLDYLICSVYESRNDRVIGISENEYFINGFDIRTIGNYPEIEAAIRESIGVYDRELTQGDFLAVRVLDISHKNVRDITPLAALLYLRELNAVGNPIRDFSPLSDLNRLITLNLASCDIRDISTLTGLTGLTELDLAGNSIKDYSPLASLPRLKTLNLESSSITDISSLAALTNVSELSLAFNEITDLSPLEKLTNLTVLSLYDNRITDITPLGKLTGLTSLDLSVNSIEDVSPLSKLTRLQRLSANRNNISDLSGLSGMTGLSHLDLSVNKIDDLSALPSLPNLTAITLHGNLIEDISPLAEFTGLTSLWLSDNKVSDISALSRLTRLSSISLANNEISDITPIAELTELSSLYLNGNRIDDISPVSSLSKLMLLYIGKNSVSDIAPIGNLKKLEILQLDNNPIADISVLANLTSLLQVTTTGCPIVDFSPIAHVKNDLPLD